MKPTHAGTGGPGELAGHLRIVHEERIGEDNEAPPAGEEDDGVPPAGEDDEVQPAGGDDDEVQPAGGEDDEVQPLLLLIRGLCSLSVDLSLSTSPCFAHVSFQSLSPSSSFFDTSLSASLACRHALSHALSPRAHTTASLDASSRCLGERTLALAQPRSQSPGSKGRLKEKEIKRERM